MTEKASVQASASRADQQIDTSELLPPGIDYLNEFNQILQEQFGIAVINRSGHQIGCSKALPWKWTPVTGFRETLKGKLGRFLVSIDDADHIYVGSNNSKYREDEYDWCLFIEPAESYREKFPGPVIQCKVTPGKNFHDTEWFPLMAGELNVTRAGYNIDPFQPDKFLIAAKLVPWALPSPLLDHDLCIYGPYVIVEEYDNTPREIHPIDAIWWREPGNQVRAILLQDAAKGRFREASMFEILSCDDEFLGWKPWLEYPQLEEIHIPFVYNPQDGVYQHIEVKVDVAMDITTHLQEELQGNDDAEQHQLLLVGPFSQPNVMQLPVLVRVTEKSGNRRIAVQFDNLTSDADGVIRGYVKLVAALGDKKNRHEGVLVLTLTFKKEDNDLVAHP